MRYILIILCTLSLSNMYAQMNCNVFEKDSPCYEACNKIYGEPRGDKSDLQGAFESQQKIDSAIVLCPTFADAYYTKAIPYLKRGEFIIWKKIINKAVELDTIAYLGYRGGARFMFIRDYEGAIEDIEKLQQKAKWDIGAIYNGEIHLEIIRALSYRELGDKEKAVDILKVYCTTQEEIGSYGLFYLGVTLYQLEQYDAAKAILNLQIEHYNYYADTYFYLAMVNKELGDLQGYRTNIAKAREYYMQDKSIRGFDSYMDYPDKVYLTQIEEEIGRSK